VRGAFWHLSGSGKNQSVYSILFVKINAIFPVSGDKVPYFLNIDRDSVEKLC
jgi:hypothetical protein